MNKLYVNLDVIVSITINYEELTSYVFYPEQDEEVKYTGLIIKKVVNPWRPARWMKPKVRWDYYEDSDIRTYEWFRVDDELKKIFKRPIVTIKFINGDTHTKYFNTDEELDIYVSDILSKTNTNIQLIQ